MTTKAEMISVQDVFKDYYEIPDFQREYSWDKNDARQLAEDIRAWFYDEKNELKPLPEIETGEPPTLTEALQRPYFLGLMVASRESGASRDEPLVLIDAQQRVTTLFLLFCAIRRTMLNQQENVPSIVQSLLRETRTLIQDGTEREDFKLKPQYVDDEKILDSLYSEGVLPEEIEIIARLTDLEAAGQRRTEEYKETVKKWRELLKQLPKSHKNMRDVYQYFMEEFLDGHFSQSDSLREFAQVVSQGVTFARIVTEEISTGMTMFERINARGVDLTEIDLIKSEVLKRTPKVDRAQVNNRWKHLFHKILQDEKNPMVFFRYFIASEFTGRQMSEAKLYEWFKSQEEGQRANIELIADSSNMPKMMKKLSGAAEFYARFLKFNSPSGTPVPNMQNISYLGGTSMKQQNFLFMGGRDLSDHLFSQLAQYAENFIFHVLITKQQTNFLETQFPKWAKELRGMQRNDKEAFKKFIEKHFVSYMNSKQEEVQDVLDELAQGEDPIKQKYRTKYVLAKLAQHIQKHTDKPESGLQKFCEGNAYEIDQVVNSAAAKEANWTNQEPLDALGNLTLLTKEKAKKVRGMSFEQKIPEYKTATLLMTRAIVSGQGNHFKSEVDPEPLQPYSSWGPDEIAHRQQVLAEMGMRIWGAKA